MCIRKSEVKGKNRTYTNYLLVESVSTPKGPRQKVICSLGDLITSRWLRYLVAARQSERDQWIEEFEEAESFAPVIRPNSPWNEGKTKPEVRVALKTSGQEAHVLCHSEGRTEKDRAIRLKTDRTDLTFHDLRHTLASRLVAAGVNLITVQHLLGHASITMTMWYAHLAPGQEAEAVERLSRGQSIRKSIRPLSGPPDQKR